MTQIKERAIEMLQDMPDDKVIYILEIMEGIKGLYDNYQQKEKKLTEAQLAYEGLKKYKGKVSVDLDYKAEIEKARMEKYENIS